MIDTLINILPVGAGLDASWHLEEDKNKIIASSSFHCMNEHGYYDGWIDFSIEIPKNNPLNFKLKFQTDSAGWYRIYKYMLREYLEDIIAYSLGDIMKYAH
jgi:hypothetical protein